MNKKILSLCTVGICFLSGMNISFADDTTTTNNQILDANDARAAATPGSTTTDTPSSTKE